LYPNVLKKKCKYKKNKGGWSVLAYSIIDKTVASGAVGIMECSSSYHKL